MIDPNTLMTLALLCTGIGTDPTPQCEQNERLMIDPLNRCWCEEVRQPKRRWRGVGGTVYAPDDDGIYDDDTPSKGNPGNDKPVGNAGENPSGKGNMGSGSKGKSDGKKGKNK